MLIEQRTQFLIRTGLRLTQLAVHLKDLLRLGKRKPHDAILPNVDEEIGMGGIQLLVLLRLRYLFEAEDDAGLNYRISRGRRHNRIQPEWRLCKFFLVVFNILDKFHAEIVKCELVEGNALVKLFKVKDFLLKFQQLLVAVFEVAFYGFGKRIRLK